MPLFLLLYRDPGQYKSPLTNADHLQLPGAFKCHSKRIVMFDSDIVFIDP